MAPAPDPPHNPGLAPYGNFINYYSFNSAEERMRLLPDPDAPEITSEPATTIWAKSAANNQSSSIFVVLDVGCNAGNFTQLLPDFLAKHTEKQVHILGVDIDADLIDRAQQHNNHPERVTYKCLDIMTDGAVPVMGNYLRSLGVDRFDATFCMSLTMWIHLNHGDAGLVAFLRRVHDVSRLLIVEPQPWKCYQTARRRMKRAEKKGFEKFVELKMRSTVEEDIHRYLMVECNRECFYQSVSTKWDRKIAIYI